MTRALLILAVLSQSGCVGAAIYGESRKVTREGIAAPLATMMPETENRAATDCVMKGLSQGEIISLPNSGTLDDPARAEAFVSGAMARPGVGACLAAAPKVAG
jgi:hypothetical protein